MKKTIYLVVAAFVLILVAPIGASAQADNQNVVHITRLKMKTPENGTWKVRDSLITIYNTNVIQKNEKILSHREFGHFFTANSTDYVVIEEFKDFASLEEAAKISEDLEKKAWPDEKKRKEFLDAMNSYFERWHSDELYRINAALSKN